MPRFDLIEEVTSVYLPKAGRGPLLPKNKPRRIGRLAFGAALAVLLAAVVVL